MPVTAEGTQRPGVPAAGRRSARHSTETKASFKTTELIAYVAMLVGLFIAGLVTSAGTDSNGTRHADVFGAHQVWLYATILTVGYMISRGLAKAGSREQYDD